MIHVRALLLFVPALVSFAPQEAAEVLPKRTNFVYILADDLGYAELGSYGQEKIRTPNLDRIAREGMRFTQHYSGSSVCGPSRGVLLTGLHTGHAEVRDNWENGGWGEDEPEGQWPFAEGTVTFAKQLQGLGYRTGAFGKWGNGGPGSSGHPNRQGFDTWLGYLCQRKAHNYYPKHLWKNEEKLVLPGNGWFKAHQKLEAPLATEEEYYERYGGETFAPDVMIAGALEFLDEVREEPFLLYYASPVPHVALQVPRSEVEAYRGEFEETPYLGQKSYLPHPTPRAAYAAMITRMDREVGAILDKLDALGLADNTVVMFSSDNGTTYAGGVEPEFFDSVGDLRGLKGSFFEGGIRVPFLVRWPGEVRPGTVAEVPSGFQDVFPTVMEIAGGETPEGLDGISLVPSFYGNREQLRHDYLYWERGGAQAIRVGQWKGVRTKLRKGDTSLMLFDLARDGGEQVDISAEHPDIVAFLEDKLAEAHTPSEAFPLPTIDVAPK